MSAVESSQPEVDRWIEAGQWSQFGPTPWEPQKCETCHGRGEVVRHNHLATWRDDCPDCKDGKRRLPVTVPCEHPTFQFSRGRTAADYLCTRCRPTGRTTVAWATVEWVGLVQMFAPYDEPHWSPPKEIAPYVTRQGTFGVYDGVSHWSELPYRTEAINNDPNTTGPVRWTPITLPPDIDPASLVGQWARGGRIEVVKP